MATLTRHRTYGLQIVSPTPTGDGGQALNDNFKALTTVKATTAPTTSDNYSQGFIVGSRWFNTTTGIDWICTDPGTSGSPNATWVPATNLSTKADLSHTHTFLSLTDTPSAYTAGKYLIANSAGTAVIQASYGDSDFTSAGGTLSTLVSSFSSHTASSNVHNATSANTANRIVMRDGSGNFAAGTATFGGVVVDPGTISSSTSGVMRVTWTNTATSGWQMGLVVQSTYNAASGGPNTVDLLIERTDTSINQSAEHNIMRFNINGQDKLKARWYPQYNEIRWETGGGLAVQFSSSVNVVFNSGNATIFNGNEARFSCVITVSATGFATSTATQKNSQSIQFQTNVWNGTSGTNEYYTVLTRASTTTQGEAWLSVNTPGQTDAVKVHRNGNVRIAGNLGVGNAANASTPGTVVKKIEIFDASGNSLGFIPVYNSIT